MSVAFGDFEAEDAWSDEDYDPEAVARFYVDTLHGFDGSPVTYDGLPQWERAGIAAAVVATLTMRLVKRNEQPREYARTFWKVYAGHDPSKRTPRELDDIPELELILWIVAVLWAVILWVERQGAL